MGKLINNLKTYNKLRLRFQGTVANYTVAYDESLGEIVIAAYRKVKDFSVPVSSAVVIPLADLDLFRTVLSRAFALPEFSYCNPHWLDIHLFASEKFQISIKTVYFKQHLAEVIKQYRIPLKTLLRIAMWDKYGVENDWYPELADIRNPVAHIPNSTWLMLEKYVDPVEATRQVGVFLSEIKANPQKLEKYMKVIRERMEKVQEAARERKKSWEEVQDYRLRTHVKYRL